MRHTLVLPVPPGAILLRSTNTAAVVAAVAATTAVDATEIGPPGEERWYQGIAPPPTPAPGSAAGTLCVAGSTGGHTSLICAVTLQVKRHHRMETNMNSDDLVIAKLNKTPLAISLGDMRLLRETVMMKWKDINRSYEGPFLGDTLLHLVCREG